MSDTAYDIKTMYKLVNGSNYDIQRREGEPELPSRVTVRINASTLTVSKPIVTPQWRDDSPSTIVHRSVHTYKSVAQASRELHYYHTIMHACVCSMGPTHYSVSLNTTIGLRSVIPFGTHLY